MSTINPTDIIREIVLKLEAELLVRFRGVCKCWCRFFRKKKKQRRATMSTIPMDIIREILLKLEAELLVRIRGVCKSWNEVITDPGFIKEHLTRVAALSSIHNSHIIIPNDQKGTFISVDFSSSDGLEKAKTKELRYPMRDSVKELELVGSCNGIVCLQNPGEGFILWNPTTGISRKVRYRPDATGDSCCYFGYSREDEYHVVRVWRKYCLDDFNVNQLDSWSWRMGTLVPEREDKVTKFVLRSGVFLDGALYLLVFDSDQDFMISYDLSTKSISRHELPTAARFTRMERFGELLGNLCVIGYQYQKETFCLWLMKTGGGRESWENIVFEGSYGLTTVLPYMVEDNDGTQEVLGIWGWEGCIKWFNFKNKRATPVHLEGQLSRDFYVFSGLSRDFYIRNACVCLRTLASPFVV